jgi:gas vesicle protein
VTDANNEMVKQRGTGTMSAKKVLVATLIGIGTGAILGVLFAPARGSATRKRLSKGSSRYMGALRDTAGEYVDTLEETFESARETAVGFTDKVKNAVDSLAGH